MHLGSDQWQVEREAARQSPQILVQEPGAGHDERRLRGDPSSEAAAAGLFDNPRLGVFPDLSLPYTGAGDARPSDRHRPLQIRRIQAERVHQGDAKRGLLETRPALSRWYSIYDHQEPLDRDIG